MPVPHYEAIGSAGMMQQDIGWEGMFKRCLSSVHFLARYCHGVPHLISKLFIQSCQRARAQVKRTTFLWRLSLLWLTCAKFCMYHNNQKFKIKNIKSCSVCAISIVECLLGCEIYMPLNLPISLSLRFISIISIWV